MIAFAKRAQIADNPPMVVSPAARRLDAEPRYVFKPSPYSSHALLLACLPAPGKGSRVLDIGCGPGHLAEILAARGYEVIGIEKNIEPSELPENLRLIEADLDLGLPPVPGQFEFVLCADVLEHLRDPLQLLREIHEVLGPRGRLIASLPNSGNAYFRAHILAGRFPAHDRGLFDRTHLHFYTWGGWVELFARGGFRIEGTFPTGIPIELAFQKWERTLPVRIAQRVSYTLARAWSKMFAYQFVIVARPESAT